MTKTIDEILEKYFFVPPVHNGMGDDYCIICGTPFVPKKWKEQRIEARKEIIELIKRELKQAVIDADHKYKGEDLRHAFNHIKVDMLSVIDKLKGASK